MKPHAKDAWSHQKLEEASKDCPLQTSEGDLPHQHCEFELLVSKIVREYISVVLSHQLQGNLLSQP